jgi:hypothetical protein
MYFFGVLSVFGIDMSVKYAVLFLLPTSLIITTIVTVSATTTTPFKFQQVMVVVKNI